jgi:hypothetical protein
MNGMDGMSPLFSIDRQFAKVEVAGSNPVSRFFSSTTYSLHFSRSTPNLPH